MRRRLSLVAGAVAVFASLAIAEAFTGPPTFSLEAGEAPTSTFGDGIVPATRSSGNVFVLDPTNDRVQVFGQGGAFVREFGQPGNGDGDFGLPSGIAVGANNHVYVGDSTRDIVQEFQANGTFVRSFGSGSSTTAEGQFVNITAIAVRPSDGHVFVLDNGKGTPGGCTSYSCGVTIQEFGATGAFVDAFGLPTAAPARGGELNSASALAIDPDGGIWIADTANHRVQRFDENNEFDFMLGKGVDPTNADGDGDPDVCADDDPPACVAGTAGAGVGEFTSPIGIAIDADGNVFITDGDARIQKVDPTGAFQPEFLGAVGDDPGTEFNEIGRLANIGSSLFIADTPGNDRIQRFSTAPAYDGVTWGTSTPATALRSPGLLDVRSNRVYVPDRTTSKILIFNREGDLIDDFDTGGSPTNGLAVAPDGSIYATVGGAVKRFNADGTPGVPASFPSPPASVGPLSSPSGVAILDSGDVLISDTLNDRVLRFTATGAYVSRFGSTGSADGQLQDPQGLHVNASGDVWVADSTRVQLFDPDTGTHLDTISGFADARDVAIDSNGDLWVTQNDAHVATNVSLEGAALTQLGTGAATSAEDALHGPVGIDVNGDTFWVSLDFGGSGGRVRRYDDPVSGPSPPVPPDAPGGGSGPPPTGGSGGGSGGFDFDDLDEDAEAGVLVKDGQRINKLKVLFVCILGPCDARVAGKAVLTSEVGSAAKSRKRKKEFKLKGRRLQLHSGQSKKIKLKLKQRKRSIRKINRLLNRGWEGKVKVLLRSKTRSGLQTSRETIRHIRKAK